MIEYGFISLCCHFPQWEPVQFFNNKIICDLVEEKHRGIISILVGLTGVQPCWNMIN